MASSSQDDFLNAVVAKFNEKWPDLELEKRYFSTTLSTEFARATRWRLEPGRWEEKRETRGIERRTARARLIVEGYPASVDELNDGIVEATAQLETIASELFADPYLVDGYIYSSCESFDDARGLYSIDEAENGTPCLFAGLALTFFWVV